MNERKAAGLADRIYSDILNRIVEGEFKEGDRLLTEHALAERFATSRPTVREALARLRADGIIVTRRGSGTVVGRRPDPDARRFAPVETLSDIRRCYEFRLVMETGAAELAADNAEDSDLHALRLAWNRMASSVEAQKGIDAHDDFAFRLAVARTSRNPFFVTMLSFIEEQIIFSSNLSQTLSPLNALKRQRLTQQELLEVLEAIEARDREKAAAAMDAHLRNALERMFGV
ncbi:FadR/GntR family transcriptional regulator [Caballeronia sp. LZ043]|uniref:FadR/GntR family transcriptional regulator n=1 Tax=Caballeronia sp. LZ043 TaxID=3038569 RepID=UPI00285F10B9|nr:FadR/GntR family transcriptional regulator [Caballeronia sp. LZ043]MDR5824825.1 FadR/GntR family transcriptional regulator [Caballeronia sp. LZ043]